MSGSISPVAATGPIFSNSVPTHSHSIAAPVVIEAFGFPLGATGADDLHLLDRVERARAGRFHFDLHRQRYIAAHATVRRLLGERLGLAPADVPISRTPLGKPILGTLSDGEGSSSPPAALHFNLTHCEDLGWLAMGPVPVGIDVERIRELEDLLPLIQSHCTADEIDTLIALPQEERAAAFLRIWTRKEAVLKAWGTGIGEIELHSLHVGLGGERVYPGRDPKRFVPLQVTTRECHGAILSIAVVADSPPEFILKAGAGPISASSA